MPPFAAQTRGNDSAPRPRLPHGGGNTVCEEYFLEHIRRRKLVTGRIGRVDLDIAREQIGRFLRELVEIDRLGRRRLGNQTGLSAFASLRSGGGMREGEPSKQG